FDAEHCPKNVELCSWLRSYAEIRYVICPTSPTAKMDWPPDSEPRPLPMIKQVFGDFLPKNFDQVSCWHGFEADVRSSSTILDLTEVAMSTDPVHAVRFDAWGLRGERFWFGLGVVAVSSGVLCLLWSMRRRFMRSVEGIVRESLAAHESRILHLQARLDEQAATIDHQSAMVADIKKQLDEVKVYAKEAVKDLAERMSDRMSGVCDKMHDLMMQITGLSHKLDGQTRDHCPDQAS
ncbi:unnamed protein product, partial [Symbiodinium sp. CCMP2592]